MAIVPAKQANSFYITGGTLPLDATSYVVRQADTDLFESLSSGEFCYVLNTRQMGKSSLMVRTAVRLRRAGARVAVLDLTAIGQNLSAEQWYDGLLNRLARQIDLEDELEEFYHANPRLGPMQRFMEAIARIALSGTDSAARPPTSGLLTAAARVRRTEAAMMLSDVGGQAQHSDTSHARPLIIFVDEIDAVRSLPFSVDEFFAGIRECYNRRTEDPVYRNLVFCLLGVATPSDLVTDTRMSPFNIGRRIVLADFTPEEASPLAAGLALDPDERRDSPHPAVAAASRALLARVLYRTNGHPYMTQRLCRAVAEALASGSSNRPAPNGRSSAALVDSLCASLFFSKDARDNDDNLAFVRNRLLRGDADVPALLDLYRNIRIGRRVRDDETSPLIAMLRLSGIVKVEAGLLVVRNRIYAHVFDPRWILAYMPGAELERQRAAYRAGVVRSAIFGGALALALGALTASSLVYKHRAEVSARTARDAAFKAQASAIQAQLSEEREKISEQHAQDLARSEQAEKQKAIDFGGALAQTFDKLTREQKVAQANFEHAQKSAERANRAESSQQVEMKRLNHVLYDATMNLVQREYEAHEFERMQELLNQTSKAEDKGFEWRFWQGLCPLQHSINAHAGEIYCVAYSPDGSKFATGGADKRVVVSDAVSGKAISQWKEDGDVRAAAFSPDGRSVVVGLAGTGKPGRAVIREADTGKAMVTVPVSTAVWGVALSHDGARLATNGDRIQVWDASTGAHQEDYGPGGPAVAFAPNDSHLCFSRWCESGKPADVDVVDLKESAAAFALTTPAASGQVRAIAWSGDGTEIATAGDDRAARLWDARTGRLVRSFVGHGDAVISASFAPDSKRLVTSSLDDETRVWDVESPDSGRHIPNGFGNPPNGFGGPPGRFPPRDVRGSARENRILFKHARYAAFSSDGRHIVTGSYSGMVRVWSALLPASYLVLEGPPVVSLDHVGAVAFAPDNRQIVSAIDSPIASVWEAATGLHRRDLRGHVNDVSALAFFPDSTHVVSGGWDGAVKVWDINAPRRVLTLQGHRGNVNCVAVAPDGHRLVTAGEDRTGIVWDAHRQKRLCTLSLGNSIAHGIAFSPDSARIVIAQNDNAMSGRITLWDASTGRLLRTIATLPARVLAARFSPDGTRILAGVDDKTARIWDAGTGKLVLTLSGHTSGVNSVAFSSDGRRIATGSFDTTVKLWDARTGHEILTLHHPSFVVGVAISPDRKRVVTACEDGSTRVWTAD